ncbi:MAG: hypothetical protein HW412_687 [Bacteroidetes bacterium]|nr:hypothetical protein [Bacteroidota bacterium]
MKQMMILILLLVTCAPPALQAQYIIEYPYLYFTDFYTAPTTSSAYFIMPRPTDIYTSTRIRTLSGGFSGLIRDAYTDHFRNPAMGIDGQSCEAFGDLASANDLGRFTLGGFIKGNRNTIGVATTLDKLLKRTTTNNSSYNYLSPGSTSRSDNISEVNPERIGGRVSGSFLLDTGGRLGASYEYAHAKNNSTSRYDYRSESATFFDITTSTTELVSSSNVHNITLGGFLTVGNGTLQILGRGVFSKTELPNRFSNIRRTSYSRSSTVDNYSTEIKTKGFLAGMVFECLPSEQQVVRIVVDLARTSYTTSGTSRTEASDSGFSVGSHSGSGSWTTDGGIIDIRAGVGYERRILNSITGYVGFSLGYIRNSYDGNEKAATTSVYTPNPPINSSSSSNVEGNNDAFDARLPLGIELMAGEHVTIRGGIEPRYRSGETSNERRFLSSTMTLPEVNGTATSKVNQRGLSFATQFGAALHHQDFGEISILFGKNLTDTNFWAFFLRYFV